MSFGIATFPNDGRSSEEVFRCAETAMFKAKENGKNMAWFYRKG
jgi:GGDEF domain-containing protein